MKHQLHCCAAILALCPFTALFGQKESRPVRRPDFPLIRTVSSCQLIASEGYYELDQDLVSQGSCITISGAHEVTLNCRGHKIMAAGTNITVVDSTAIEILSCTAHRPVENTGAGLAISNSQGVGVRFNDIELIYATGCSKLNVWNNTILGTYSQDNTNYTVFSNNQVTAYSDVATQGPVISLSLIHI